MHYPELLLLPADLSTVHERISEMIPEVLPINVGNNPCSAIAIGANASRESASTSVTSSNRLAPSRLSTYHLRQDIALGRERKRTGHHLHSKHAVR